MKSDFPPLRQQALQAAREAARRRGVTAGEWLDAAILDAALQQGVEPKRSARPRYPCGETADERMQSRRRLDMSGDQVRGDLTESLLGVAQALQQLSHRIDRNGASAQDPATLRQIEGALIAMRGIAARVASSDALAKLSDEVRGLAGKIDQAAGRIGGSVLSALEGRFAGLADALETRGSPELEGLVKALIDKIERGEAARDGQSSLARLEGLIEKLAEKLDACDTRLDRLEAIERGLARLQIEPDMRSKCAQGDAPAVPTAASFLAAGVPIPPPPVASTVPPAPEPEGAAVAPRPASQPGAHAAASDRDSPEPRLPPDHPPKSGPSAVRSRNPGSPTDRVFNSEAAPGPAKPPADTDCGGKSDFIAAARRAVQAAGEQGIKQNRGSAPLEIVSTAAGSAGRIGKLSALIGVMTAVLTVLGGLQIARTLRSSTEAAKVSALDQAAGGPAPPASAAATIGPPASQASGSGHLAAASVPGPPGASPP